MQILKSKHNSIDFYQIYVTKEEMDNEETQKRINKIKNINSRVAIFESGDNEYLKIIERIIKLEVEKINGL